MPSSKEPTKTSAPSSTTLSKEEVRDLALEGLKKIMPSVIAKPKPKKPIPRHVN